MNSIKKILIVLTASLETFYFIVWMQCEKFADSFHFSLFDVHLKIKEAISNDVGYSPSMARLFHNKLQLSVNEIINKYLLFWDIRFEILFFSFVGVFGLVYGVWKLLFIDKRTKITYVILAIILLLPLIEVFSLSLPYIPYTVKLFILFIPYQLLSLYGLWGFMRRYKVKGIIAITVLLLLSIWYISVFPNDIVYFCQKK